MSPPVPTPLITRHAVKGDAASSAVYSACERYRYALTRIWDTAGPKLAYVMLNPSKATEAQNDPTIERCERRARALGFGGMRVTNVFAWRETDPRELKRAADPTGPDNDAQLVQAAHWADTMLVAWGVHATHLGRAAQVTALLESTGQRLYALGTTKDGHPRHPLYVAYATQPTRWPASTRA